MKITNNTRALVAQALRAQNINPATLAKKIGVSRAWTSRFLKEGGMKTLTDDMRWRIEEALGIRFVETTVSTPPSALGRKFEELTERDARLAEGFGLLFESLEDDQYYAIPFLTTRDLVEFGKEIMRAAHEDPDKPGKVGHVALDWLSKRFEELKRPNQGELKVAEEPATYTTPEK